MFSGNPNPFSPSPKHANSASGRPPLTPLVPPLVIAPISDPLPRDRRAFSFPAAQMFDPLTKRRDSMILPAFARKPKITNHQTTTNTTPVFSTTPRSSLAVPAGEKLSRSTGANTPLVIESVFCSTSESSDNEGTGKRKIRLSNTTASTAKPTSHTRVSRSARPSLPVELNKNAPGSLRAPSYLASKEYASRQKSQSPVSPMAGVVASSSSSRSREDIISWAKAVKSRPGETDTSEDESRNRGRSRTRKDSTPETVKEMPEDEHEHLATTPKGRMESVFSGLNMGRFGVGPIVKALTSVTGTGSATTVPPVPMKRPEADTRALTSAPSPAMVSKVAVVSSTASGNSGFAVDDNQVYFGGATPTLSTVSLSEVNDPTSVATDTLDQDHGDLMTNDDQSISAASSSHRHRRSTNMMREAQSKVKKSTPKKSQQKQQAQPPSPVRAANTTSSVIWNLSSYLRSFTPFTLPSPSARTSQQTSPGKATPTTEISEPVSNVVITSPVPASRMASRAPSPGTELVRSLPLDIIAPVGGTAFNEDRARHREAQEYIESMKRRSRSRRASPKRPSRSRGRSPSTRPLEAGTVHARKWSYDADQSDAEEELAEEEKNVGDDRRGRSSRSKALVGDDVAMIHHVEHMTQQRLEDRSRSRGRDATDTRASRSRVRENADIRASRSRGRRESPRGRGRDRTARAV